MLNIIVHFHKCFRILTNFEVPFEGFKIFVPNFHLIFVTFVPEQSS